MARPRKTAPRDLQLKARFTEAEAALVQQIADHHGLTVSEVIRMAVLNAPNLPTRRNMRPVKDGAELARVMGQLGKIGSNVNQIAHAANMGLWPDRDALAEMQDDLRQMRDALFRALGMDVPQPTTPGM